MGWGGCLGLRGARCGRVFYDRGIWTTGRDHDLDVRQVVLDHLLEVSLHLVCKRVERLEPYNPSQHTPL